jgi:predicted MFS family arabinose efflux permease
MVSSETAGSAGIYFGWKVVGAAFAVAVFGFGIGFYGPSVFLRTLHGGRGWPISLVSAAITAHFISSALCTAYLPEAYDRWGVTRVMQAGAVCAAVGIVLWAAAPAPWLLFPIALISGAGSAATTGAAINAIVAPWFDKERPKALSMAFNGASVGGLLFTPLWVALIDRLGFAVAAVLVGGVAVAILWPVSIRYLGPPPSAASSPPVSCLTKTALLKDWRFVTISAAFALGLFAQVGLVAHLLTRLTPEFGAGGAAWAMSLVTMCAVLGRSLLGWLIGERNRRQAAALNFLIQASGTTLLAFGGGVSVLACGCVLCWLGFGNLVSLPPLILQKEFPAVDVGRAVALTVAINQAVFAFAPAILGVLRDVENSYTAAFSVVAAIPLLAALIVASYRVRGNRAP